MRLEDEIDQAEITLKVLQMLEEGGGRWYSQEEIMSWYASWDDSNEGGKSLLSRLLRQMEDEGLLYRRKLHSFLYVWWHYWLSGQKLPRVGYQAVFTKGEYLEAILFRVREKYFKGSAFAMLVWSLKAGGWQLTSDEIEYLKSQLDFLDSKKKDS